MIKTGLLLLLILFLNVLILAQRTLPAIEHFDYTIGDELRIVGAPDWQRIAGNYNDLFVVSGNLTYLGYPMSATGNQIEITQGSTGDDYKFLIDAVQSSSGVKIYCSFLLDVINSTGLRSPSDIPPSTVFADLGTGVVFPSQGARIYIQRTESGSNYKLGIGRSAVPVDITGGGYTGNLNFNTTYLIVIGYEFVIGDDNDIVRLWVNPDLSGTEPIPTLSGGVGFVSGYPDNNDISGLLLRQASGTPNGYMDAIRIATTWSEAPLPVELSSFSAATIGSTVKLNWRTDTEVNNFGFEVERTSPIPSPYQGEGGEAGRGWEKIGFVNGNGNSNSPKDYSFEDKTVAAGRYSYRLKQIDNDGQFEYSKTIEVDLGAPKKFELSQNYPNPFNPVTTIRFNLPETGIVKLTLYNVLGQEIQTLLNENKEAGVYTINFDASELNSGVYIYKLESGSFVQTRKMMLLK